MKMQTIEQINKKICKALNVEYSEFVKMNFEGKNAITNQYTINVLGLKFKNHK